jgi:hypothetical protein
LNLNLGGWRCGLSSRGPAYQVGIPKCKPQHCQKKKKTNQTKKNTSQKMTFH